MYGATSLCYFLSYNNGRTKRQALNWQKNTADENPLQYCNRFSESKLVIILWKLKPAMA